MIFNSPSYGICKTTEEAVNEVVRRIGIKPDSEWTIAIGTDSQNKGNSTKFCNAILILEKGSGGTYFYSVHSIPRVKGTQHRMLKEAEMSIKLGHEVIEILEDKYLKEEIEDIYHNVKLEIHCDLGRNGKSRNSINAAIGWINAEFGNMVTAKIKPNSPAASYVADKYTK